MAAGNKLGYNITAGGGLCVFSYRGPWGEITSEQGMSKLTAREGSAGMWRCFPSASSPQAIATSPGAQGRHPECARRAGELKNKLIRCGPVKQKLGVRQPVSTGRLHIRNTGERGREDLVGTNRSSS